MRKEKLNRSIMLMGTALMTMGLLGCAPMNGESWEEEPTDLTEAVEVSESKTTVCEDGNCEVSDDFLINQFSQTSETDSAYTLTDEDIMAMSKPSSSGKVSVKEKQMRETTESMENKVVYTSLPLPEKTTITKTTTDVVVKTTPPEQPKVEEPEVVVQEEVKVENPKIVSQEEVKAEEPKITIQEEVAPVEGAVVVMPIDETEALQGEEHQIAAATVTGKIVKEIEVPLKKTTTTITETTTKVQKEKKAVTEPKTLLEKVEYGDSIQEWEAKSGDTLKSLLVKWSAKTGWTVVWKLDRDYHLEAGVIFRGTFTDVSSALIRSFARATPAPIGTFYKGNRVLVITTQEDENER